MVLAILLIAAWVEYIFPPFPGDTIIVCGAFLAATHQLNLFLVLGVSIAGSMVGALCDFYLGKWIKNKRDKSRHSKKSSQIDILIKRFKRHGAIYMTINRFFPGVRALFFIAAGMADLKAKAVLFWAGISALIWNILLVTLGFAVGKNWDRFRVFITSYISVAQLIGIIVVLLLMAWFAFFPFINKNRK